jgi:hypothetical protein
MATYETASVVAPYANKMIASEEKEPNGGWNYATLITKLGTETFYDDILSDYAAKSAKREYYTLSCFDLNAMAKVDDMLSLLIDSMQERGKRDIVNAINSSVTFGLSGSGLFDLGNLFSYFNIEGDYLNYVSSVNSDLRSGATGLSIYFPLYDKEGLNSYINVSSNEKYKQFLTDFAANDGTTINFLSYVEIVDNKLSFTLESSSMANYAETDYVLFEYYYNDDGDGAYLLGNDNDVTVVGNQITVSFEGRWVEFGGNLLCCTILDEFDGYTIYQAPVMVNDENAKLLFGYNSANKSTNIIGVVFEGDDYARLFSLDEGDMVLVIKKEYSEEEYINIYSNENEFEYSGQSVNVVTLPDGVYQYSAFVRDVYGTTYPAGTAVVKIVDGVVTLLFTDPEEVIFPEVY